MLHGQFTSISRAWHLYGATCRFRVQGRIGFSCWHLQARLLCSKSEKSRIYEETSSDSAPINRTGEGKAPFFSRLKDLAWRFWNGTKGLMSDQKTAVQLALRYDQLNRKEKEFIRNARSDVLKILPVLVLFCIPFVGYAAPLLAFRYPRRFLSRHFLTARQICFNVEVDYKAHSDAYNAIMQSINSLQKDRNVNDFAQWHQGKISFGREHLMQLKEFVNDQRVMSRDHLVLLCKSRLLPTLGQPQFLLIWRLKKSVIAIHEDDREMKREGIRILTEEDSVQACKWRGLKTVGINRQLLLQTLQQWLSLSHAIGTTQANDIKLTTRDVLLLAHALVFTAVEHEQKGTLQ